LDDERRADLKHARVGRRLKTDILLSTFADSYSVAFTNTRAKPEPVTCRQPDALQTSSKWQVQEVNGSKLFLKNSLTSATVACGAPVAI